jgi:hypothetical protein
MGVCMFITHVYESRHRQIARRLGNVMLCNCRFFQHFQRRLLSLLRNISILPILLPLHIILLDQPVDIPLDIRHRQHAPAHRRLDNLTHELLVSDRLAGFHDPHNRGLGFEVAVLGHAHVRLFVLFLGLFELDLVDFDAVFGVREVRVEGEGVGGRDVFGSGVFG